MKKAFLLSLVACLAMTLGGCQGSQVINAKVYEPYGILDEAAVKQPNVVYQISATNCIIAFIFSETVIIPAYVIGWDLWVPVREVKPEPTAERQKL